MAAAGALIAASGYLLLSGGNVATERAFIMVAVALGALIIGRRALTLRAVAIAATIVLVLRPEALTGPGFQMSFAATTGLVAVFGLAAQCQDFAGAKMAGSCGCDGDFLCCGGGLYRTDRGCTFQTRSRSMGWLRTCCRCP